MKLFLYRVSTAFDIWKNIIPKFIFLKSTSVIIFNLLFHFKHLSNIMQQKNWNIENTGNISKHKYE